LREHIRFLVVLGAVAGLHAAVFYLHAVSSAPVRHGVLGEVHIELMPAPSSAPSRRVESTPSPKAEQPEQPNEHRPHVPPPIREEVIPVVSAPRLDDAPVTPRPVKIERPKFEIPPEVEKIRFVMSEPPRPRVPMPQSSRGSVGSEGADAKPRGEKTPPTVSNTVRKVYPETARRNGWEGTVKVWVRISAKGEVTEARVEKSSGYDILDTAARDYARQLRFDPAREDGRPVETSGRFDVNYRLY
jgi:protein TonB